uniref:Myosin_tail_1 domain-containing protein n=1 Tax=Caenorhabditis tropicalis TaxID=1561998 RepID=A0A1I7SZX5_9PELO
MSETTSGSIHCHFIDWTTPQQTSMDEKKDSFLAKGNEVVDNMAKLLEKFQKKEAFNAKLETENNELKDKLKAAENTNTDLENKLNEQKRELKDKLKAAEDNNTALQNKLKEQKRELKNKLKAAEDTNTALQSKLKEETDELKDAVDFWVEVLILCKESHENDLNKPQDSLKAENSEILALKAALDQKKAELQRAQDLADKQAEEILEMKKTFEVEKNKIRIEFEYKIVAIDEDRRNLQERNMKLQDELCQTLKSQRIERK